MAQEQPPPQLTNGTEGKDVLGQTWELEGVTEVTWAEVAAGEASGDTGSMDCIGSWRKILAKTRVRQPPSGVTGTQEGVGWPDRCGRQGLMQIQPGTLTLGSAASRAEDPATSPSPKEL